MPTLASMRLPPPTNWDEFEDITLTCLSIKWESPDLTKHGRRGQAQGGVDIYGRDSLGRFVGIQCKKTDLELKIDVVRAELKKAETFTPQISAFYLATTQPSDAKLQKAIRLISEDRVRQSKFPVGVFFWDDLLPELSKNRSEFAKHYPDFGLADAVPSAPAGARRLSLLDISYLGLNLKTYMGLIFGELGQSVGEDPYQFASLTRVISNCALVLFDSKTSAEIDGMTKELNNLSIALASGTADQGSDWVKPNSIATTIQGIILGLQYSLTAKDLDDHTAGSIISFWQALDINANKLSVKQEERLLKSIKALSVDATIPLEILETMQKYRVPDVSFFHNYSDQVYSIVRQMIVDQEITGPFIRL